MSNDEKLKLFVELVKTLAWPAFAFWVVWYLRDELKRVATRITELGFSGAKFAPPPPEQQVPSPPPQQDVSLVAADQKGTVAASIGKAGAKGTAGATSEVSGAQAYIAKIKQIISEDQLEPTVQKMRQELVGVAGENPTDQMNVLIYLAASLNIQITHERNYNIIFGSQLNLMAQMNVDSGVTPDVARSIYEAAKKEYPAAYQAFSFEQWIGFLTTGSLVTVAANGNYQLTGYGRGLMKYILDRHLSVNRPY